MTEQEESVVEAVEITPVKNEIFTQEICMEEGALGLEPLPLVYQQQVSVCVHAHMFLYRNIT